MIIKKTLLPADQCKPLYQDASTLPFGRVFTDHMFTMKYNHQSGWHNPEIRPYASLSLDPAANVFHYGQEVFEGQKAYKSPKGDILLFRPYENARRMNESLKRICMPEIPENDYVDAQCELIKAEQRWIPQVKGSALYVRPTAIGTEAALGVRPADEYLFFIIVSPSGPYFQEGFRPVPLWVSDSYSRAATGGTGEAKTGGNYAGSMLASKIAKSKGYSQVLWLDAAEHKYIEEVGAMNIFFLIGDRLLTPSLRGSILRGVTRDSVLKLAAGMGVKTEERDITIDEIIDGIKNGKLTEAFGAGTAAVISPVSKLHYQGQDHIISDSTGPLTQQLFDSLTGIQYGEKEDSFGWVYRVN